MANESCSFIKDKLASPTLKGPVWHGQTPKWQSLFYGPLSMVYDLSMVSYSHTETQEEELQYLKP